jgi:hypothetical protein
MTAKRVHIYDVKDTPWEELLSLEDALEKGYTTDDEKNKVVSISVKCYPIHMFHALYKYNEKRFEI